jgi:hypothetical protein
VYWQLLAKLSLSELDKTFYIAIILIVAYLFFFWMAWNYDTRPNASAEFPGLKIVTSTLGALAGIIIGYYFGNKPVDNALKTAVTAQSLLKEEKVESVNIIEDDLQILKECSQQISGIAANSPFQSVIDVILM